MLVMFSPTVVVETKLSTEPCVPAVVLCHQREILVPTVVHHPSYGLNQLRAELPMPLNATARAQRHIIEVHPSDVGAQTLFFLPLGVDGERGKKEGSARLYMGEAHPVVTSETRNCSWAARILWRCDCGGEDDGADIVGPTWEWRCGSRGRLTFWRVGPARSPRRAWVKTPTSGSHMEGINRVGEEVGYAEVFFLVG
jgi:hypothetical protein